MTTTKVCPRCGNEFTVRTYHTIVCPACEEDLIALGKEERAQEACIVCRVSIAGSHRRKKFCSKACQKVYRNMLQAREKEANRQKKEKGNSLEQMKADGFGSHCYSEWRAYRQGKLTKEQALHMAGVGI